MKSDTWSQAAVVSPQMSIYVCWGILGKPPGLHDLLSTLLDTFKMVHHNSIFPAQTNNILNDNCHPNPVVSPYGLTQSFFKLHSLKPFDFVLNPTGLALVHLVFGWKKRVLTILHMLFCLIAYLLFLRQITQSYRATQDWILMNLEKKRHSSKWQ